MRLLSFLFLAFCLLSCVTATEVDAKDVLWLETSDDVLKLAEVRFCSGE